MRHFLMLPKYLKLSTLGEGFLLVVLLLIFPVSQSQGQSMKNKPDNVECSFCSGSGYATCMMCMGTGTKQTTVMDAYGYFWPVTVQCDICGGNGAIVCISCRGTGDVEVMPIKRQGNSYFGSGGNSYDQDIDHSCRACNNTGVCPGCYGKGSNYGTGKCTICHGTGKCPNCGGRGYH